MDQIKKLGLAFGEVGRLLKRSAFKANVILLGSLRAEKMAEEQQATKESSTRKRRKRSKGSQTDNEDCEIEHCHGCTNMAESLAEINSKLDKALTCIGEMEVLKQKQENLEKKNKELEDSLSFAHTSIEGLQKKLATQELAINELNKSVISLTKQANEEKQRAIKLESHSRRNNLNFFNLPEQKNESAEKSEKILRKFMEENLKISKEDASEIYLERVHRVGKPANSSDEKPRPLIAKFSFYKDKEFVLSRAKYLKGTDFAVACDFPKEIVDKRKALVPILKDAKKRGQDAKLIFDKLYINGQVYTPTESL